MYRRHCLRTILTKMLISSLILLNPLSNKFYKNPVASMVCNNCQPCHISTITTAVLGTSEVGKRLEPPGVRFMTLNNEPRCMSCVQSCQ